MTTFASLVDTGSVADVRPGVTGSVFADTDPGPEVPPPLREPRPGEPITPIFPQPVVPDPIIPDPLPPQPEPPQPEACARR